MIDRLESQTNITRNHINRMNVRTKTKSAMHHAGRIMMAMINHLKTDAKQAMQSASGRVLPKSVTRILSVMAIGNKMAMVM